MSLQGLDLHRLAPIPLQSVSVPPVGYPRPSRVAVSPNRRLPENPFGFSSYLDNCKPDGLRLEYVNEV